MIKIIPPKIVRDEPKYMQKAYIREFQRLQEQTNDFMTAKHGADLLLKQMKYSAKIRIQKVIQYQKSLTVSISAHISEMSAEQCLPTDVLSRIKSIDPHPYFVVYDVGGEGVSDGRVDRKKERKIWSFSAIKQLAKKLMGAGIIVGHNELNEDTKPKYGKIIHTFTKKIKDSLHAIGVAYITDLDTVEKIKNGKLDVCSVEGDVLLARDRGSKSNWFIRSVDEIKNLALGHSSVSDPGFNGAGVLATIQEMNKDIKGEN